MLMELRSIITDFLNKSFIENSFILINSWSIFHVFFGIFTMIITFKYYEKSNYKLGILFLVLVLWELFEMALWETGLFRHDPAIDILWDLIIGFVAGLFVYFKKNF